MKALVLEVTGRKAILLLPGGEMRTVRAKKDWTPGMEVSVKPYPLPKKKKQTSPRAVLWPLTACTAAFLIVFAGFRLLGGAHIDRQHPIAPLSSGSPAATHAPTDAPTNEPTPVPSINPTPTAAPTEAPLLPTPGKQAGQSDRHAGKICDECGQTGHDDDHCPNEVCDECGQLGHDDDHCPSQRCDECGRLGHDDDHCPYDRDHHDD